MKFLVAELKKLDDSIDFESEEIQFLFEFEDQMAYFLKNLTIKIQMKLIDRPLCGCGNTSNPNGYCDGSHNKK